MSRDGQHKQEARTRLYTAIDASKRPQYISHVEGGKGGAGMAGYWALEAAEACPVYDMSPPTTTTDARQILCCGNIEQRLASSQSTNSDAFVSDNRPR